MIGMILRLRFVVWAALFLWIFVLGMRREAFEWVVWPLITAGCFLVFWEYLLKKDPELGKWLVPKAMGLLFVYGLVFTGLPWIQEHLPETFGALKARKGAIDRQAAERIEPCLDAVQAEIRRYTQDLERTEATNVARELNTLLNQSTAGEAIDPKREEAVRERIRALARNRQEWRSVVEDCEKASQAAPPSSGPAVPAKPPPDNGSAGGSGTTGNEGAVSRRGAPPAPASATPAPIVPTPPPASYYAGTIPSGNVVAIEPAADASVEVELSKALKGQRGAFTREFFSDGVFDLLFGGDRSTLRSLPLASDSVLFACKSTIATGRGHSSDLKRADVRLTCRRLSAAHPTSQLLDAEGTGTGFSDSQAIRMGVERAARLIGEQLERL